ncbi:MAG: cupin domain-containing protein [Deltaproteobacteria bacterium]|nr:cupin domain-containing protein [Deltaproteobacteria bacterium]
MSDVRELLPLYVLGALDPGEMDQVTRAVSADPQLADELAALEDSALALIAPLTPSPDVHARLLSSIGAGPYELYAAKMARLYDVTLHRSRELLGLIARKSSWETPLPGVHLVHFDGGPAYAGADCGFVKLEPGTAFPQHRHLGEEVSLIIAGRVRDRTTGRIYGPGDEIVEPADGEHDVICEGDEPCIYAARAMNGISIAGAPVRPSRNLP